MANSRRFRQLNKRLDTLADHFLPEQFSPIGQYTDREEDHARAYVLLVHAEVESFIEDRVKEIVTKAHARWTNHRICTRMMVRLLRHHLDSKKLPWKPVVKSDDAINAAVNSFSSVIASNNGIKEANLLIMLFPLGVDYRRINTAWLATIDSFGTDRGTFAHTSQMKAHQAIDPQNESDKVRRQILPGLKKLDRKISRL
jgi:hypothetical protein